jgi:hypothetical protein
VRWVNKTLAEKGDVWGLQLGSLQGCPDSARYPAKTATPHHARRTRLESCYTSSVAQMHVNRFFPVPERKNEYYCVPTSAVYPNAGQIFNMAVAGCNAAPLPIPWQVLATQALVYSMVYMS